jgi:hypothetical protein
MRLTPAGCQGLGAGAAALASPTPSFFRSSGFSFFPTSSPSCGGQGGTPMGRRRSTGRCRLRRLLVGAAPRV